MFQYRQCVEWLKPKALELREAGYDVEVIQNEIQLPTFAIKVTSERVLADLVVWEHGLCSMQVYDPHKEKLVFEKHDHELSLGGYQNEIVVFFAAIAAV